MTRRPRVCFIVSTFEGATWALNQLRLLRDEYGYDVTAVLNAEEGSLVTRLRAEGIRVLSADFDFASVPATPGLLVKAIKLGLLLRREQFDIVQTALWQAMLLGRVAAWLADVPVRLTMVAGTFLLDAPIARWIDSSTCWMESAVIGSCKYIVDTYREFGISDDRLALIYYGPDESGFDPANIEPSDIRQEYGWAKETPIIGHVAWFYQRVGESRWVPANVQGQGMKGHEELIRSAPAILKEFPDAKVVMIGGGWTELGEQFKQEMEQLVAELGLEESVIFAGPRSNVAQLYPSLSVSVQPSLSESCGGTCESLLMERPTVGTRIGGIPDMVIHNETGILVNPGDPADLARGICDLLRDPDRAASLSKRGRQHVLQTATLTHSISDLDKLYRRLLFSGEASRKGYRWWITAARLPVLAAIDAYLNIRLGVIEYYALPRWQAGVRPWHIQTWTRLPSDLTLAVLPIPVRNRLYLSAMIARGYSIAAWNRSICTAFAAWGGLKLKLRHGYQLSVSALYRRFGLRRHAAPPESGSNNPSRFDD